MEKLTIKVDGMSCSHCVSAVKNAVLGVEGVTDASVDLEAGEATVEGSSLQANLLIEAIKEEGFRPSLN